MLEGVALRGTGAVIHKTVGKPLGGKTGTTNEEKDAWFIGFSPDIAMGVFIGYDNPKPMGHGETGGGTAAPIFADFFKLALKDKPGTPFRTPPDIRMVMVNKQTGLRTDRNDPDAIEEYFKPGTEPAEGYPVAEGERAGDFTRRLVRGAAAAATSGAGAWRLARSPRATLSADRWECLSAAPRKWLSASLRQGTERRRLVLTQAGLILTQLFDRLEPDAPAFAPAVTANGSIKMRPETLAIVDEIKQSLSLLRRYL